MNSVSTSPSRKFGGRDRDRTGDPLLAKHRTRFHPLHPLLPTTNVSNKSGNLLLAQSELESFENDAFLHSRCTVTEARLCYYVIELLGMPARESRQQVGRFWIFGE
jgi:hypothetical protein